MKQEQPTLNGCFNRAPFLDLLTVQDGWNDDGTLRMKVIPFRNSMDCQYSRDTPDTRCAGCKWNQQEQNNGKTTE